ncbi:MAG TPA: GFA family protein [Acetobacteraceae bacterium]|nr:GFA family protein [Acetobacteraceae bacterium]
MASIIGGCLCGKVRYSAETEPVFTGVCHCRNCQKASGSAFAIVIGLPQPALSVQGEMKTYTDKGDSGQAMLRRFCPECGSTVMDEAAAMPGIVMVQVGTLDDPSWVKPAMQIYCDSAQPWVQLSGDWQRFPKMPG